MSPERSRVKLCSVFVLAGGVEKPPEDGLSVAQVDSRIAPVYYLDSTTFRRHRQERGPRRPRRTSTSSAPMPRVRTTL